MINGITMWLTCEVNEIFTWLKPMTLNTMLYYRTYEDIQYESVDDYRDPVPGLCEANDDDPLKEQSVCKANIEEQVHDPSYIRWQIFDEIPERLLP